MGIVVRRLLAPGSWLLVPGSCYWLLVPGSWHLVPGSWHLVPGSCRSTWRQKFKQILDELSYLVFNMVFKEHKKRYWVCCFLGASGVYMTPRMIDRSVNGCPGFFLMGGRDD